MEALKLIYEKIYSLKEWLPSIENVDSDLDQFLSYTLICFRDSSDIWKPVLGPMETYHADVFYTNYI